MADLAVETIYDRERKRRVVIYRRDSGTYGYREEYRYENAVAEGWAPLWGPAACYEDLETAKRELVHQIHWIREIKPG